MIQFVSDLRQVGGFLRVLRFPPPVNWSPNIAEISLKVALNTIIIIHCISWCLPIIPTSYQFYFKRRYVLITRSDVLNLIKAKTIRNVFHIFLSLLVPTTFIFNTRQAISEILPMLALNTNQSIVFKTEVLVNHATLQAILNYSLVCLIHYNIM